MNNNIWTIFFTAVAMWAAITTDCLSEEMDDPDNIAAWYAAIGPNTNIDSVAELIGDA